MANPHCGDPNTAKYDPVTDNKGARNGPSRDRSSMTTLLDTTGQDMWDPTIVTQDYNRKGESSMRQYNEHDV